MHAAGTGWGEGDFLGFSTMTRMTSNASVLVRNIAQEVESRHGETMVSRDLTVNATVIPADRSCCVASYRFSEPPDLFTPSIAARQQHP